MGPWGKEFLWAAECLLWVGCSPLIRKQLACLSCSIINLMLANSRLPQVALCHKTFGNHVGCWWMLMTLAFGYQGRCWPNPSETGPARLRSTSGCQCGASPLGPRASQEGTEVGSPSLTQSKKSKRQPMTIRGLQRKLISTALFLGKRLVMWLQKIKFNKSLSPRIRG